MNKKPLTKETKQKISKAMTGKKQSPETIAKRFKWRENGLPEEIRIKMKKGRPKGKKHWNWQGGLSNEENKKKYQLEYNKCFKEKFGINREKAWQRKNPEKYKLQLYARNKRERDAGGNHTNGEWETLKAQYNWTCLSCKKREPEIRLTRDHIIPVSKSGSNNIENIQPLCQKCNSSKYTKVIKYLVD